MTAAPDDLNVIIAPEAQAQIDALTAKDPGLADSIRETLANMHQAAQAVQDGRYATFEDAMEAISGSRPRRIGEDEGEAA